MVVTVCVMELENTLVSGSTTSDSEPAFALMVFAKEICRAMILGGALAVWGCERIGC